jgi:hypothetical protein
MQWARAAIAGIIGVVPVVAAAMPLVLAWSHDTFEITIRHYATCHDMCD